MKRRKYYFLLIALLVLMFPMTVQAKQCKDDDCTRKTTPGPDSNGYCSEHDPRYLGSEYCAMPQCHRKAVSGSKYCSLDRNIYEKNTTTQSSVSSGKTRVCLKSNCNRVRISGSSYCSVHDSNVHTGNKYKDKEYKMPDCDDYEDYEDFMDDWDGKMPDGSEAEDYWENW